MRDLEKIKQVNSLVSKEPSGWKAKAEFRKANRKWLQRSAEISLKILDELRNQGISQAELARKMAVTPQHITKLVKGQENLTLETIGKIETALNINLIDVMRGKQGIETGFHALIDNATFSETLDLENKAEGDDNKIRPLLAATLSFTDEPKKKYYE